MPRLWRIFLFSSLSWYLDCKPSGWHQTILCRFTFKKIKTLKHCLIWIRHIKKPKYRAKVNIEWRKGKNILDYGNGKRFSFSLRCILLVKVKCVLWLTWVLWCVFDAWEKQTNVTISSFSNLPVKKYKFVIL